MRMFQILDACSRELGNCCSDYGTVAVLDVTRKIFDLFQIFIPILLLVMATINFIALVVNPDAKNGKKKIINQFLAAVIVFFIPTLVNAVINMTPDTFQINACWQTAKVNAEIQKSLEVEYKPKDKDEDYYAKILINPNDYESGNKIGGSSGAGSATGKAIVDYALSFVGKRYVLGGSWNGELPYTPTDCSGFVRGVFKHHDIHLTRTTRTQWADKSSYTLVGASEIKAGDVVMYDGHVALLTGNGNEIVHAANSRRGIVKDKTYKYRPIKGIMRIKGVN